MARTREYCPHCNGYRNCEVRGSYSKSVTDPIWENTKWQILECAGCDLVFVVSVHVDELNFRDDTDEHGNHVEVPIETRKHWPPLSQRESPPWLSDLFSSGYGRLRDVLREVYTSNDVELYILCAIGIRTAFDVASEILGVPDVGFDQKLRYLTEGESIAPPDAEVLRVLVKAGSASAHRGWTPTAEEIATLLSVLETFIETAIISPKRKQILANRAAAIAQNVPNRGGRTGN